ncbi:MAG TPA: hypothetical protein VGI90_16080 [Steroidobacteraceae bacterium]
MAFLDMGSPKVAVSSTLFQGLNLSEQRPLEIRVGSMSARVPSAEVESESGEPYSVGADRKVEATLGAGFLQWYQVVIDYQRKTLTLAPPGSIVPEGIGVPFRINETTGLIAIDAIIDGKSYAMTVDSGSAYSWVRQTTAQEWLTTHHSWERGVGAVGVSNMMMSGDGAENSGVLLRIPQINIGTLRLREAGVLAAGPGKGMGNSTLFDWYSTKNAVPVIGWIGGNVLKHFRLTIDYPHRMLYWVKQTAPDLHELDQVGLTLRAHAGEFFVSGIATKNGKPTVEAVNAGDRLLQVDQLPLKGANWGAVYAALHGSPDDVRMLVLNRAGTQFTVKAKVTAF